MTKRTLLRRASFVVAMVVVLWLAYGPLFAWSPITPGFRTTRTTHAVILFRDPPGLHVTSAAVDASLVRLQSDLGLGFDSSARFLLCDDWSDLGRFTPWLRVSHGVGAITLPIGLVTYVTPVVRNREDLLDFLTHEAAHALLYQHTSIRHRLEMERQAWFVEGVAVHFGNPSSYETWEEFRRSGSAADVVTALDPAENGNQRGVGGFRFSYSAYGYFTGYLVQQFGSSRFEEFTRAYIASPAEYREHFQRIFAVSFGDAVHAFASVAPEPQRSR